MDARFYKKTIVEKKEVKGVKLNLTHSEAKELHEWLFNALDQDRIEELYEDTTAPLLAPVKLQGLLNAELYG